MASTSIASDSRAVAMPKRRFKSSGGWLALPATVWLVLFFIAPLVIVIVVSLIERGPRGTLVYHFNLENYRYVDERYRPILWRSLKIAFYTTVICFFMGYPLAFFISTRKSPAARNISLFMVILPFWTNFLIRTYAWRVLLGNEGTVNHFYQRLRAYLDQLFFVKFLAQGDFLGIDGNFTPLTLEPLRLIFTEKAVMLGMVYGFLPFMVLPIYASIERFDFKLVEAAHDLGANDWGAFWRVVFPLTLPGVIAGWILVFIPAVGAFVTPDLLGGTQGIMVGNLIQRNFRGTGHWPRGSATSIALMAIVAAGLAIYMLVVERKEGEASQAGETQGLLTRLWAAVRESIIGPIFAFIGEIYDRITRLPLSREMKIRRDLILRRIGKYGLYLNPLVCYTFLWLPILVLVVFSFNDSRSTATFRGFTLQWYENISNDVVGSEARFSTALMLQSLKNSLVVGVVATLLATVIGTMVALALVRSRFAGKGVLSGLLYLPVAIPEITQGISLLLFFNILFDFLAKYGIHLRFGFVTIIIGHVAFSVSFVAIVVSARLADMNPRLEEAARDLGANEWNTFWRVTFPLIVPGVLAGALLAFTLSLDDFVVTFFTSGVGTTTLPVFVYGLLKLTVTPEINAISTLMIVASTILVALSLLLQGRNAASRG